MLHFLKGLSGSGQGWSSEHSGAGCFGVWDRESKARVLDTDQEKV